MHANDNSIQLRRAAPSFTTLFSFRARLCLNQKDSLPGLRRLPELTSRSSYDRLHPGHSEGELYDTDLERTFTAIRSWHQRVHHTLRDLLHAAPNFI